MKCRYNREHTEEIIKHLTGVLVSIIISSNHLIKEPFSFIEAVQHVPCIICRLKDLINACRITYG